MENTAETEIEREGEGRGRATGGRIADGRRGEGGGGGDAMESEEDVRGVGGI